TDDDCYVAPDWLARIVEKFDADPALALLGGRIDLHDPTDLAISVKPVGEIIEYTDPYVHMAIIYGANFAARRTLLQAIGGFDPRLGAGSRRNLASEDLEFMYRAHKSGVRVKYFPD